MTFFGFDYVNFSLLNRVTQGEELYNSLLLLSPATL